MTGIMIAIFFVGYMICSLLNDICDEIRKLGK